MERLSLFVIVWVLFVMPITACSQQQQVDRDFSPQVADPLFGRGKGPLILVDGGHHNFHTLDDKFAPFCKVAEMDGFNVQPVTGEIKSDKLKNAKILVIANAISEKNMDNWKQPVYPAFTAEEISVITKWVQSGGRLFLIADHMPFSGATAALAQSFGYTFYDGFALRKPKQRFDVFSFSNGMLAHNAMTNMNGWVDSIVTFTGQAFKIPDGATSVITFDSSYKVLLPEEAWEFDGDTKMISGAGLSQLAYNTFGAGKVVVSGEAAMFTAQRVGDIKFGMNAEMAPHNMQLLLNILEWLNE